MTTKKDPQEYQFHVPKEGYYVITLDGYRYPMVKAKDAQEAYEKVNDLPSEDSKPIDGHAKAQPLPNNDTQTPHSVTQKPNVYQDVNNDLRELVARMLAEPPALVTGEDIKDYVEMLEALIKADRQQHQDRLLAALPEKKVPPSQEPIPKEKKGMITEASINNAVKNMQFDWNEMAGFNNCLDQCIAVITKQMEEL